MDDKEGDQREPHRREENADVPLEKLVELGVLCLSFVTASVCRFVHALLTSTPSLGSGTSAHGTIER